MKDTCAYLRGDVDWPKPMSAILRNEGLAVSQGRYAITIDDCDHFLFREYGGDMGDPIVEADAETVPRLINDASMVSLALAKAQVDHLFQVYDQAGALVCVIRNGLRQADSQETA